tara:strand:- start:868 stop:1413 length:546 start_codon:yes stop_codon:yes gene_type:complete
MTDEKVIKYTKIETIEKRIEYIESRMEGDCDDLGRTILQAIIGGIKSTIKTKHLQNIEDEYKSLMATAKARKVVMPTGSAISDDDSALVLTYIDSHEGGPHTWSDAQVKFLALINRPSKKGNTSSLKEARIQLKNKAINNLERAFKNKLWNGKNQNIKAPPAVKVVVVPAAPKTEIVKEAV